MDLKMVGTAPRAPLPTLQTGKTERVGWAKRPDAHASGSVPTILRDDGFKNGGHGAKSAFAHPTDWQDRARRVGKAAGRARVRQRAHHSARRWSLKMVGTAPRAPLLTLRTGKTERVGWAKRPDAHASGGVPTILRDDGFKNGGHGAKSAFAYPTDRQDRARRVGKAAGRARVRQRAH